MTTITKTALTASLVLDFVEGLDSPLDLSNEKAVKAAIRALLNTKRVTEADLKAFLRYADPNPDGKSIVRKHYKKLYKPMHNTCGDEFATLIRRAIETATGNGKQTVVDPEKLRALADANGVWRPNYDQLNVGQQRMNVGNRLRAMAKRGDEIVWNV